MNYSKIRKIHFNRNIKIFKEDGWDYKFLTNPYRKIKTLLNLEISAFFLYLICKTKIKPNSVTIFGVFWVYFGSLCLISLKLEYIYLGLFIYFTKLIPDYIDGALAYIKNQQTEEGHNLDLWAGKVNRIGVLFGVLIYLFKSYGNNYFLYLFFYLVLISVISSVIHSNQKNKIVYNKEIKSHSNNNKNSKKNNEIISILKFFNYDGRSSYSDFIILLIIIDINYKINDILLILPWIWFVLNTLSFFKLIYSNIIKNK